MNSAEEELSGPGTARMQKRGQNFSS